MYATLRIYVAHGKNSDMKYGFQLGNQLFDSFILKIDNIIIPVYEINTSSKTEKCFNCTVSAFIAMS